MCFQSRGDDTSLARAHLSMETQQNFYVNHSQPFKQLLCTLWYCRNNVRLPDLKQTFIYSRYVASRKKKKKKTQQRDDYKRATRHSSSPENRR